ncbi:hypothetical protein DY000_02054391 [Brassica cretica]|uniref:Uncharacterized protein n=1 Tax=Brassica cretica TaxID=69181 RepID=A0ABQ7AEI3_BRACR|nr:hypothetical protein DY000_02054391 [Brassica cretica]
MYRRRTFLGQFRRSGFLGVFRRKWSSEYSDGQWSSEYSDGQWSSEYTDGYLSVGIFRRILVRRKLLTALRRLSDEIPTDVKQSVGIPSVLSNLKRLCNGHIYLSATVTWFVGNSSEIRRKYRWNSNDFTVNRNVVGNSSEYSDQLPTTTTVTFFIGMSSKSRRNSVGNGRRNSDDFIFLDLVGNCVNHGDRTERSRMQPSIPFIPKPVDGGLPSEKREQTN